jgi:hypothetical protein
VPAYQSLRESKLSTAEEPKDAIRRTRMFEERAREEPRAETEKRGTFPNTYTKDHQK